MTDNLGYTQEHGFTCLFRGILSIPSKHVTVHWHPGFEELASDTFLSHDDHIVMCLVLWFYHPKVNFPVLVSYRVFQLVEKWRKTRQIWLGRLGLASMQVLCWSAGIVHFFMWSMLSRSPQPLVSNSISQVLRCFFILQTNMLWSFMCFEPKRFWIRMFFFSKGFFGGRLTRYSCFNH